LPSGAPDNVTSARPPTLLHVFPTFSVGGAQARMAAVANRFGRDWHHAIIAMDGNLACRERLSPTLDVSFPQVQIRKGNTAANAWHFRSVLADLRPHRLITHNFGSIEWAIANALRPGRHFARVPHIHIEDGFGPEERQTQIRRRVLLRRWLLRDATVVLPSQTLCTIARNIWQLPPAVLRYIPNGIDLNRFANTPTLPRAIPVIGTVAALRAEKNLSRLLRAFARIDAPCRLALVGDGAERPALEALAAELGIAARVDFLGHRADPSSLYAGFDIFALSSDTEQMPLTVLEAMAAGLPIASTDVGDVAAMLSAESRFAVTALDDAALGTALATLVTNPDLRHQLGTANRAKAEREYGQEAMFAAYADLFSPAAPT
jgi:glycosyltransferase involved in cell wall biosynthesis